MTRAMTSMLTLALLALPVLAEEPKKTETPAQDSPLVAAAKRSNRLGKKPTNVITNETLKKSGANAHVTTTANQKKLPLPQPTIQQPKVAETKKAEPTPEQKKEREMKVAAAVEATEEEPFADDVDPAQAEKALQDAQAAAAQDQKPPR